MSASEAVHPSRVAFGPPYRSAYAFTVEELSATEPGLCALGSDAHVHAFRSTEELLHHDAEPLEHFPASAAVSAVRAARSSRQELHRSADFRTRSRRAVFGAHPDCLMLAHARMAGADCDPQTSPTTNRAMALASASRSAWSRRPVRPAAAPVPWARASTAAGPFSR